MKTRKLNKQKKLRELQIQFYKDLDLDAYLELENKDFIFYENPYVDIDQRRHNRRVFGHDVPCGCTFEDSMAAITWNQPSELWAGKGREHYRRYRARIKRKK